MIDCIEFLVLKGPGHSIAAVTCHPVLATALLAVCSQSVSHSLCQTQVKEAGPVSMSSSSDFMSEAAASSCVITTE